MKRENDTIVIIGDWFVDENWLMAKHYSYSSSHTGDIHYLSKHSHNQPAIRLCGAPSILQALSSRIKNYKFIGFGVWNELDNNVWKCVLCKEKLDEKTRIMTHFSIRGMKEIIRDNTCPYTNKTCNNTFVEMINLAGDKKTSSNRIIRIFEGHSAGEPKLLYRFDCVLPINNKQPTKNLDYEKLQSSLNVRTVKAIVIQDHGKGVINDKTIETLIEVARKNRDVKWYIHSKVDNPEWLIQFKKADIQLRTRLLHYELANYKSGPRRWLCGNQLGRASLELLGELSGSKTYKHGDEMESADPESDRVAILLDDNKVIAKEHDECINLHEPPGPRQLINIGRTTTFYACLVLNDIKAEFVDGNFFQQCNNALNSAYKWSQLSTDAWKQGNPDFYPAIAKIIGPVDECYEPSKCISYSTAWKNWNESSTDCAIVGKKIQVWRGESGIKGYICPGGIKRDSINNLLRGISEFVGQKVGMAHPFNSLLISRPGWGKSYLAESLADHFGMSYMGFSLAQMATTQDMIDCFDAICSHQNREKNKSRLLIFMDEVNADIEGNPAMGLLLGPIWDGKFLRNGNLYLLLPAVWIFASTESVKNLTGDSKGSDFVSRLNGPIIRLDSLEDIEDAIDHYQECATNVVSNPMNPKSRSEAYAMMSDKTPLHIKTEQVYLGVSLLNKFSGPLSYIEERVLQLFHDLVAINGVRSLEFFTRRFRNIQRSRVEASNVPQLDQITGLQRHILLPEWWIKQQLHYGKVRTINIETLIPS